MGSYKQKIKYEEVLSAEDCVMYLRSITEGLESRKLRLTRAGRSIELNPADLIQTEIRATKSKTAASIRVEFTWSATEGEVDLEEPTSFFPPPPANSTAGDASGATEDALCHPEHGAGTDADASVPPMMLAEYLDTLSRDALYEKAQATDVQGRSSMGKDELVIALSGASGVKTLFTHQELYAAARWANIPGRSTMDKDELLRALHSKLIAMASSAAAQ